MVSARSLPFAYLLAIFYVSLGLVDQCLGDFNAKTAFTWVDSSCNSVIDQVNAAGGEYNTLVGAAVTSLNGGTPSTDLGKGTLLAYFGTDVGALINSKYAKLQSAFADSAASRPKPLELYCDGSAFEWVTTYQEGDKKGQPLPGSGQWHAKEGRYNPAAGPLYLSGTKTDQRTSICQDPTGKNAEGVSAVGGTHVILCPDAFKNSPVLGAVPTTQQTIGTSLDTLTSTGAILLHEVTHCILSTKDIQYKVNGVLLTAKISSNAQKNADTWMYYAMASRASQNAWVVGLAQALDDWGPKAPKAPTTSKNKRDTLPFDQSPKLDVRQNAATVTVTVTVTQNCASVSGGNSASGISASAGSTASGSRSAGPANSASNSFGGGSTASSSAVSAGSGTGNTASASNTASGGSTASNSAGSVGSSGIGNTASVSNSGSASISGSAGAVPSITSGSLSSIPNTNSASGFTTRVSNSDSGSSPASGSSAAPGSSGGGGGGSPTTTAGYIGPAPLPTYPASEVSANTAGLTTHASTTTPVYIEISSSVSSNGHTQKTNGAGPFPIFWSHTCWFCPPGLCLSCGAPLNLDPGIYPPGSINPPPGWKGPLPTITIGNDGTPSYDEDEPKETNQQPSNTAQKTNTASSTAPRSSGSNSATQSSSSATSSGVNYIFETPEIYSEVSDTIPFSSISALVASEFAANSIIGGNSAGATTTGSAASSTSNAGPVSTTFSSSSSTAPTPSTTPKPSSAPPISSSSATAPAFSCTSMKNPTDPDYPCLCNGEWDYISMPAGGCGWTSAPPGENSCENCQ